MEQERTPSVHTEEAFFLPVQEAKPPVVEERSFSGALFGFSRRQVLDYVRGMSEQTAAYTAAVEAQRTALNDRLANAEGQLQRQKEALQQMEGQMAALQTEDAHRQTKYDQVQKEFQSCREKLFNREQKYAQLQRECNDLRGRNAEMAAQIEKAKELIRQHKERLEAEEAQHALREEELRRSHELTQKRQEQQHAAQLVAVQQAAAEREEDLRRRESEELQAMGDNAEQMLDRLGRRVDAEQERLARGVEKVDADLASLKKEMEQVQQQIWAAHAMIRQTTQDMHDLLQRVPPRTGAAAPAAGPALQPPPANTAAPAAAPVLPTAAPVPPAAGAAPAPPNGPAALGAAEGVNTVQGPAENAAGPANAVDDTANAAGTAAVPGADAGSSAPAHTAAQPRDRDAAVRLRRTAPTRRSAVSTATVRGARETVADYLLDTLGALGRLWEKK